MRIHTKRLKDYANRIRAGVAKYHPEHRIVKQCVWLLGELEIIEDSITNLENSIYGRYK